MNFFVYSHPTFEPWSWLNPDTVGIGGSETSHIEMCRRLAERGHDVTSYAPVGSLEPPAMESVPVTIGPAGVPWIHSAHADLTRKGIWVIYRHPEILDVLPAEGNTIWLVCQDVEYRGLTEDRAKKLTRIVALCERHVEHLRGKYPWAKEKVCVSGNGITPLDLEETGERNPHRMMYASSPDRGLLQLLPIYARVKEIIPDAELHIYYGWDNMDKVIEREAQRGWPPGMSKAYQIKDRVMKLVQETGAVWHGRTPQRELAREWMKSGIWCHPSTFTETGCITSMDAQAYGAIPITAPVWAIKENVEHGSFIEGEPEHEGLVRAKYVMEVLKWMLQPEKQEETRRAMIPWARKRFDWGNYAVQWERWAEKDLERVAMLSQAEMLYEEVKA